MPARELVNETDLELHPQPAFWDWGLLQIVALTLNLKKKCQSVAFETSLSLDLLITSFRNHYLIWRFTFSTVSLFLRIPENCWCNYDCSALVSLFVGLAPSFIADALNFAVGLFICSHKIQIVPSLRTFALFFLKLHSRCFLYLKQVCCSLEKTHWR